MNRLYEVSERHTSSRQLRTKAVSVLLHHILMLYTGHLYVHLAYPPKWFNYTTVLKVILSVVALYYDLMSGYT